MLIKKAKEITGGLTYTTKMPGPSYNTPASRCLTGAKLRKVPGFGVFSSCYALKGNYVKDFQKSRKHWSEGFKASSILTGSWPWLHSLKSTNFLDGMMQEIFKVDGKHLENIYSQVCRLTPDTQALDANSREAQFLKDLDSDTIPTNLIIRMSFAYDRPKTGEVLAVD